MTGAQGFWISIIKNFGPKIFRGLKHLAEEQAKNEAYLEQQRANDPDPEYQSQRAYLAAAKEKATKAARLIGCFITLSIFIVLATCWHDAAAQRERVRLQNQEQSKCPGQTLYYNTSTGTNTCVRTY
jgi:uncharacterized protein YueI